MLCQFNTLTAQTDTKLIFFSLPKIEQFQIKARNKHLSKLIQINVLIAQVQVVQAVKVSPCVVFHNYPLENKLSFRQNKTQKGRSLSVFHIHPKTNQHAETKALAKSTWEVYCLCNGNKQSTMLAVAGQEGVPSRPTYLFCKEYCTTRLQSTRTLEQHLIWRVKVFSVTWRIWFYFLCKHFDALMLHILCKIRSETDTTKVWIQNNFTKITNTKGSHWFRLTKGTCYSKKTTPVLKSIFLRAFEASTRPHQKPSCREHHAAAVSLAFCLAAVLDDSVGDRKRTCRKQRIFLVQICIRIHWSKDPTLSGHEGPRSTWWGFLLLTL